MNSKLLIEINKGLDFDCRTPCEEDDGKPPPSKDNMDTGTGFIPSSGFVVRRCKSFWKLLGDWDIPVARSPVFGRCLFVPENLQSQ